MKKGVKKLLCIALVGGMLAANILPASAATHYPESFSNVHAGGVTATGKSTFNDPMNGRCAKTSCSIGASTSTSAAYTYRNNKTGKTETKTVYAVGQYGSCARCSAPTEAETGIYGFLDISIKGTHNYTIDGETFKEITECLNSSN